MPVTRPPYAPEYRRRIIELAREFEILAQSQTHHGQSFLQPLAQGDRRAGMRGFQAARKILEQAASGC